MKHKKMDVFNLESLLESAKIAEKISDGMVDESVYNVLSKEGSLFESLETNEISAILESGSEIKPNMPDVDELDAEIKKAFGLLESELFNSFNSSPTDNINPNDYTRLKGKTVLLKSRENREVKAKVMDVTDDNSVLVKANGGITRFSNEAFKKIFQRELNESETPVEEPKKEVVMEAKKEETPVVAPITEAKDEAKLGDGMDGTKPALGKEESPVKDDKIVVENPTGKLTTDHVVEFKHQAPVEHSKFVAAALSAQKDAQPKAQKKFPKNVVETKLLEHGAKFESFVNSFKTPETQQLLECILEGYGICLEAQKKLIGKVEND